MSATAAAEAAAKSTEAKTEAAEKPAKEKTPVAELPVEERLIARARDFRKAAKKIGGRGETIAELQKEEKEAREKVAKTVNDRDAMNDAIAELKKVEGRIARAQNTDGKAQSNARGALEALIADAQAELANLPADAE